MDKFYELKYHRLEENQWWFKARRDVLFKLVKTISRNAKILDVGCSGGIFVRFLQQVGFTYTYGIDVSEDAISLCKEKGVKNVFVMDGTGTQFADEEFDLIIASDILEHVEKEAAALVEWHRIMKWNGKLIIFVPAFKYLWSGHDEINRHYRRYSRPALKDALKRAGFMVERSSYWNFGLFFPANLVRIHQRALSRFNGEQRDRLYKLNGLLDNLLTRLLRFENWLLLKGLNFPVGVSVFAVARKQVSDESMSCLQRPPR